MKKICLLILLCIAGSGCSDRKLTEISGKTMGTTYHVKIATSKKNMKEHELKNEIDKILKKINSSMSIYDKASMISVFNRLDRNEDLVMDSQFSEVVKAGKVIYAVTDGYWDATVGPLVELWGFGTIKKEFEIPAKEEIEKKLSVTGFDNIEISEDGSRIRKTKKGVVLDFGSIAKGYGVDLVSGYLKQLGFKDFMVEIGGEVYVSGKNIKNEKWKIGISRPDSEAGINEIIDIIEAADRGIATSGTYRNFVKSENRVYSHIIDPKTGYPVKTSLVSVTVISDSCIFADGLATGMLAMGTGKALDLCERLKNTECMTIENENGFKSSYSSGFKKYMNMK
jgi:thiamine biosynthesis lipoprotein